MRIQKNQLLSMVKRSAIILCSIATLANSGIAAAQTFTTGDLKSINHTTPWYGPDMDGCTNTGGGTALVGNDNIEKAYNFFNNLLKSPRQAAGIVGNLMQESGVNPKSNQNGGPGRGIAQWSEGQRWEDLKEYETSKGADPLSLEAQLDFLWHEMTEVPPWNKTLPAVKAATTIEAATQAFEENYEKAGTPNMANRIKYAYQVLAKYGGDASAAAVVGGNTDITDTTNCSGVSDGTNSQFVDGFKVYDQCDPAWANKPYGSSRICPSGCGPAAMAMIITNLTGQAVTPDQTAAYAGSQGMYIPGAGSSWDLPKVVAAKWNLKATFVGANVAKINAVLQSGGLVITSGSGPLPFTSGGHYIVIRALTADGKWKVGDSAHKNTNTISYDPAKLLANANDGATYAITK